MTRLRGRALGLDAIEQALGWASVLLAQHYERTLRVWRALLFVTLCGATFVGGLSLGSSEIALHTSSFEASGSDRIADSDAVHRHNVPAPPHMRGRASQKTKEALLVR